MNQDDGGIVTVQAELRRRKAQKDHKLLAIAKAAVDAYESRFESIKGRYNGPIDEEMRALARILKELS